MNQPEPNNKNSKTYTRFRGILHFAMGVLYVLMGVATIFLAKQKTFDIEMPLAYAIGALMGAYGIFRIYRGWQRLSGKAEGW